MLKLSNLFMRAEPNEYVAGTKSDAAPVEGLTPFALPSKVDHPGLRRGTRRLKFASEHTKQGKIHTANELISAAK